MYHIALVDDEIHIRDILTSYLQKENLTISSYPDAETALLNINKNIHLWIIDIMLPGMSGYDLVDHIQKTTPDIPIIFISARDQDFDKIMGLEKGGDDYLAKPFAPKELVLRVKKILSRTYKTDITSINIGPYLIHLAHRQVYLNSQNIELTTKEFNLLLLLAKHSGHAFTREQILNHVWEPNYFGGDRVVDDLMRRLRKKMPELKIETIYGFGYRLIKEDTQWNLSEN